MERVDRFLPEKDSLSRTVTLKTMKGLLRRPVQRLHRLEANSTQFVSCEFGDSRANRGQSGTRKVQKTQRRRQRRNKLRRNQRQVFNSIGEVGRMFGLRSAVDKLHDPL